MIAKNTKRALLHADLRIGGTILAVIAFLFCLTLGVQLFIGPSRAAGLSEDTYNDRYCAAIGGQRETRYRYSWPTGSSHIRVDCETHRYVIEGGKDKRSSLDSVQQAVFASYLSGKTPMVVLYDTDGKFGPYEYRIRQACQLLNIRFEWIRLGSGVIEP